MNKTLSFLAVLVLLISCRSNPNSFDPYDATGYWSGNFLDYELWDHGFWWEDYRSVLFEIRPDDTYFQKRLVVKSFDISNYYGKHISLFQGKYEQVYFGYNPSGILNFYLEGLDNKGQPTSIIVILDTKQDLVEIAIKTDGKWLNWIHLYMDQS